MTSPYGMKVLLTAAITAVMGLTSLGQPVYSRSDAGRSFAISKADPALPPVMPEVLKLPQPLVIPGDRLANGYLPASWDVAPTGQFKYSIPLEVPAGRGGMQPSLTLGYSSGGGNGLLGVGWSLGGLSSITRCSQSLSTEGRVDGVDYVPFDVDVSPDGFCLDGQKLVAIAGAHGADGTIYHTENESYARITGKGAESLPLGYDAFTVETQSGLIREYELIETTRTWATDSMAGIEGTLFPPIIRDLWVLKREQDRSGNTVEYTYAVSHHDVPMAGHTVAGLAREVRIERIDYTSHPSDGLDPQNLGARRFVKFNYEGRADPMFFWRNGTRNDIRKRLSSVEMHAPNPSATALVWRYNLTYDWSPDTQRSRVASVERCSASGGCTWAKEFEWSGGNGLVFNPSLTVDPAVTLVVDPATDSFSPPFAVVFDANGDGLDDLHYQNGGGAFAYNQPQALRLGVLDYNGLGVFKGVNPLNAGNASYWTNNPNDNPPGGSIFSAAARPVDIQGDGIVELFNGQNDLYRWDASAERFVIAQGSVPTDWEDLYDHGIGSVNFVDFNGDGLLDKFIARNIEEGESLPPAEGQSGGGSLECEDGEEADSGVTTCYYDPGENAPDNPDNEAPKFYWHVAYNMGGGFGPEVPTGVLAGAGARAVDFNGDGRGEFLTTQDGIHNAATGESRFGQHSVIIASTDGGGNKLRVLDDQVPSYGLGRRYPSLTKALDFGDFNGDGLRDALIVNDPEGIDGALVTSTIQWNTGYGFYNSGASLGIPLDDDAPKGVSIADVNRDGRDDIVSFHMTPSPNITVMLSKGDGAFTKIDLNVDPGTVIPDVLAYPGNDAGWTTSRLGDFNGDGRVDIVTFGGNAIKVLVQAQQYPTDVIGAIYDEETPWPRESVSYSHRWSDKPEAVEPCSYPLTCIKKGLNVVRAVVSRAALVDPSNPTTDGRARTLYYSYEDPVADKRGRGFLGFRKFRVWDPMRPVETVTTYDNRTRINGKYYPYAMRPTSVTTVVPIFAELMRDRDVPLTSAEKARVSRTYHVDELKLLNGGKTFDVRGKSWSTKEWEEPVGIDWDFTLLYNHTSEHIFDIEEPNASTPTMPLKYRFGNSTFDDFGNTLTSHSASDGGPSTAVATTYDNLTADWLLGLARHTTVTSTEMGKPPVTRTTDLAYSAIGQLQTIEVEDTANPNVDLRSTTTMAYDPFGNLTSATVAAGSQASATTSREMRIEYGPPLQNAPNERIYPTQVWSPNGDVGPSYDYRPSAWVATHPAFGTPIATMDVNGVQSQLQIDDRGLPRTQMQDGAPNLTLSYAGRLDSYGGYNGMIVTSSVLGQMAEVISDGLGRTLESSAIGFDGTLTHSAVEYDKLGRTIAVSRPYGQAPTDYSTFKLDTLDRVLEAIRPDNTKTTYKHEFTRTTTVDANGNESFVQRDNADRARTSVNIGPAGIPIETHFSYGAFGVLDEVTNDQGHKTKNVYDVLGRLIHQEDPDAGSAELAYNGFGELRQRMHNGNGDTTAYFQDALGRLTKTTGPDGTTQFIWDTQPNGIGRLASTLSPDGVITTPSYDSNGRAIATELTIDGVAYKTNVAYDAVGRLEKLLYPAIDGTSAPGLTVRLDYNNAEFVDQIGFLDAAGVYNKLWTVDSRNRDLSLSQGTYGNNAATAQRFYKANTGQLEQLLTKNAAGQKLMDLTYGYQLNGLVQSRNDAVAGVNELFGYDEVLRLSYWHRTHQGNVRETAYDYDTLGNLTETWLALNGGQSQKVETNAFDLAKPHRLLDHTEGTTTETYQYDAKGRQTGGAGRTVVYTDFDLPKMVKKNGQTWSFAYDAGGTRVKKAGPDGTTIYVGGLYEKRTDVAGVVKHVFQVQGTDGAIAQVIRKGSAAPTVEYALQDMLGSTGAVMVIDNNNVATVGQRFYFDPFGQRTNQDGTAFTAAIGNTRTGLTGHEYDDDFGLVNMKGRMYDARLKRFLTPDPFVVSPLFGQSWNPYSYAFNSPLNFTDPSGYETAEVCPEAFDDACFTPGASGSPADPSGSESGSYSMDGVWYGEDPNAESAEEGSDGSGENGGGGTGGAPNKTPSYMLGHANTRSREDPNAPLPPAVCDPDNPAYGVGAPCGLQENNGGAPLRELILWSVGIRKLALALELEAAAKAAARAEEAEAIRTFQSGKATITVGRGRAVVDFSNEAVISGEKIIVKGALKRGEVLGVAHGEYIEVAGQEMATGNLNNLTTKEFVDGLRVGAKAVEAAGTVPSRQIIGVCGSACGNVPSAAARGTGLTTQSSTDVFRLYGNNTFALKGTQVTTSAGGESVIQAAKEQGLPLK